MHGQPINLLTMVKQLMANLLSGYVLSHGCSLQKACVFETCMQACYMLVFLNFLEDVSG
jgi:hypothetical protein